jgi:hypothetical protein
MKKLLILIVIAVLSLQPPAFCADGDFLYLQENSSGKKVQRTLTLTPSTFLSIDGSGQLQVQSGSAFLSAIGGTSSTRTITAGTGLSGGGDLSANRTISLANTAVTAGTYGSTSAAPQIVIDAQGRITSAGNATITPASIAAATAAQGALADTAVQPTRTISTTAPLTGGGNLTSNLTLSVGNATTSATGVVELATDAETQTGTDTARPVPVSALAAWWTWVKTQAQTFASNLTVNGNTTLGDAAGDEVVLNDDDPRAPNLTSATYTSAADDKVMLNGNVGDARYGAITVVRLSSDFTVTNNATETVVTGWSSSNLALAPSSTYIVDANVVISATAGGWRVVAVWDSGSGGQGNIVSQYWNSNAATPSGISDSRNGSNISAAFATSGTIGGAVIRWLVRTGTGSPSFELRFRQNTADASNTSIKAGSFISIRKIE